MLEKKIRNQALAASKRKDNIERDIMRLALSEIEREGFKKELTEKNKEDVIRKLIKSNISTLEMMDESNKERDVLCRENDCLKSLLPKEMTKDDILTFINSHNIELNNNVGKSIGIVMKVMKEHKKNADGKLIKQVITEMFEK